MCGVEQQGAEVGLKDAHRAPANRATDCQSRRSGARAVLRWRSPRVWAVSTVPCVRQRACSIPGRCVSQTGKNPWRSEWPSPL
eukprot:2688069-Prymnesium_polylepis.1